MDQYQVWFYFGNIYVGEAVEEDDKHVKLKDVAQATVMPTPNGKPFVTLGFCGAPLQDSPTELDIHKTSGGMANCLTAKAEEMIKYYKKVFHKDGGLETPPAPKIII